MCQVVVVEKAKRIMLQIATIVEIRPVRTVWAMMRSIMVLVRPYSVLAAWR